ncbi:MAG: ABC transporter permease [Chloroflexi bacterium]|nr:ABC transporter permease [Chloroflexota bacterium]
MKSLAWKNAFPNFFAKYGSLTLMIAVCLFMAISVPSFALPDNLLSVLRQIAVIGIMAFGLTFAIAAGGFDMSIGSVAALSTVLTAWLAVKGTSAYLIVLIVIVVGTFVGWLNGLFCAKLGIAPWVGTLATMLIAIGPQYMLTEGGSQIQGGLGEPQALIVTIGEGFWGPLPVAAVVMLVLCAVCEYVLSHTRLGVHIQATGGDPIAAESCGISSTRILWIAYSICGLLAAFSGFVMATRMGIGQVRAGEPYLMDSIAAVYLGSTILKEGQKHIIGTLIGVVFMGVMFNGLTMMQVPYWGLYLFRGIMVFIAVLFSGFKSK